MLIIPFFCAAWLIQGCSNSPKDSKAAADSINHDNDSANAAHHSIPPYEVGGADAKFAVAATAGGLAEVDLGQLAEDHGATMQVRDFGAMMVKDHSAANDELKYIAESKHIAIPASIDNDTKKLKAGLLAKKGHDFDKAYVDAMVKDHEDDIKEFEEAANVVKSTELNMFIKRTMPILKMHLDVIKKIQAGMKK